LPLALRALLLLLICLVPAGLVQVALEGEARQWRGEQLGEQAMRLARLVANQQIRTLEGARQVLGAIAAHEAVRAQVPSDECDAFLARIVGQDRRYHTANSFALDGRAICSATAIGPEVNVRDRAYFQRILQGAALAVGDYAIGRGTGEASLHVAAALRGADGALRGVLVVALSIAHLNEEMERIMLPPGSAASVTDRQGVIVARTPEGGRFVGAVLPPTLRWMVDATAPGVTEAVSVDGVRRVVAYLPAGAPPDGLLVAVGMDAERMIGEELWRERRATLLILGSLLTSLALGIAVFHFGVARPVRLLLGAAQAWSRQDWRARVGRLPGGREFARLGAALDAMAEAARGAEADRAVADSRLKVLSDVSPQVVFTADARGRPDWFNLYWRELTGQTVAEAQGAGWLRAVHKADRARLVAAWRRLGRGEAAEAMAGIELRVRRARDATWRWFLLRAAPIRAAGGAVDSWVGIMLDVHDLRMAREEAAAQAARLAATYRNVPVGLCLLDAKLRFVVVNDVFAALGGSPPEAHIGQTMADTTPRLAALIEPRLREVLSGARPVPAFEIEGSLPGEPEARRWWLCHCQPVLEGEGRIGGVTCALVDITERKRAEETQALLVREVDHRSRNVLAVVRSIIRMTAAEAPADVETLVEVLEGRIAAMARVHTLLSATHWQGAGLADIVKAETAAAGPQVRVEGPPVRLIASAAQALAMVLHELVTNASKYGALSEPGGVLAIAWRLDEAGVELAWTERGGPALAGAPARRGFGSEMMDANIAGPLAGRIERHWETEGLRCVIRIGRAVLAGGGRG
jgi:PAS domain S-box-containing protein